MDFEFDPAKDATNREKHGLPLPFGILVMADPCAVTIRSEDRGYGEDRCKVLGMVAERLYAAVYTMRGGKVRFISVRRANSSERHRYRDPQGQA